MKITKKAGPPVWFSVPRLFGARAIFISALLAATFLMLGVKYWQLAVVVALIHLAHVARLEARRIELGALALFVATSLWWVDVKPFNAIYAEIGKQITHTTQTAEAGD